MINQVRNGYRGLDVAVFGCGDLESDGWLEQILRGVTIAPGASPATDVCLNLLDEEARPIPLSKGREFVGISLADIRRLVGRDDRLAVLLTSGPAKGLPLVVASRAGCADTIVCDQAAARAALEVLAHS
jgi:DNA-binding transcriptional regulator LsrR (DeoR family)